MKRTPIVRMTFECSQDWDAMQPTACGRYCDVCKKNVIDFSNRSREEYFALYEKDTQLCGRFRADQADLSLITPLRIPLRRKMILWFSGLLLTFGYKSANAQTDSVRTEQILPGKTDSAGSTKSNGYISPPAPLYSDIDRRSNFSPATEKPFYSSKKARYYWSRRFPFIARRRSSYTMGRYTMGQNVRFL